MSRRIQRSRYKPKIATLPNTDMTNMLSEISALSQPGMTGSGKVTPATTRAARTNKASAVKACTKASHRALLLPSF